MKKRGKLPFDVGFFSKQNPKQRPRSVEEKFTYIHEINFWSGATSLSGHGSDELQTEEIKKQLPKILADYKIKSMLDLPCGDFNWMRSINLKLSTYIGADIVDDIINRNNEAYSNSHRRFVKLDIITDVLPKVDLLFCRDCFVHLSNDDIIKAIKNIKKSGSKYLLTTTFTDCQKNKDIVTGDWRMVNLTKEPFSLGKPLFILNEKCSEANNSYNDKSLGLWKINALELDINTSFFQNKI